MARHLHGISAAFFEAASLVLPHMRIVRQPGRILVALLSLSAALPGTALASGSAAKAPAAAKVQALLPQSSGSLHLAGVATTQSGAAAASVDAPHAALLREDGLLDAAQGKYEGGAAGPLAVHAYRFGDATGAYAAFTAYRDPQMHQEPLGSEGASLGGRYLFWAGATLVEATVAQAGAHAVEDLKTLAAALPKAHGPTAVPPPLRGYLPEAGLDTASVHYAIGPAGYAAAGGALPESVIDFSRDAEAATAKYRGGSGTETLTLLAYPTPQMAANRQQAIAALLKSGAPPWTVGDPGVVVERIGPLVALTTGSPSAEQAHALIRAVHYDAIVTINHPEGYVSEVSKAAKLLLGIAYLIGILAIAAVLLSLFLGGGRVLIRRMRGKPDSSLNDDDFISLKLG